MEYIDLKGTKVSRIAIGSNRLFRDEQSIEAIVPREQARSQYMRELKMNEKGMFEF